MKCNERFLIPRHINYQDKGLVNKNTIDTEMIVVDPSGKEVDSVMHNGQMYIPCNIGDTIITRYTKKDFTRNFKVVDIEESGQFYICEPVYNKEDLVELELRELITEVKNGAITVNKAHLKADDLLVGLLYHLKLNRIADAFVELPKFYD